MSYFNSFLLLGYSDSTHAHTHVPLELSPAWKENTYLAQKISLNFTDIVIIFNPTMLAYFISNKINVLAFCFCYDRLRSFFRGTTGVKSPPLQKGTQTNLLS